MMAKGLKIAEPPRRRREVEAQAAPVVEAAVPGELFSQIAEHEKVQFNKRIPRGTADGYEILAIRTRKRVPDLLVEALQLLEEKYGKA